MGDKFDPARGEGLNAGGYLHLPKGMHHYEWTNEDTVIQLSGVGPVGMTYLNPADAPVSFYPLARARGLLARRGTLRGAHWRGLTAPPIQRCPIGSIMRVGD